MPFSFSDSDDFSDCFFLSSSSSAAFLKAANNSLASVMDASQTSCSFDVRRCREHDLSVLVNTLPILVLCRISTEIAVAGVVVDESSFAVVAVDSLCNAIRRSCARCGDGLLESTMSSRRDLAKDENTASLPLCDVMVTVL